MTVQAQQHRRRVLGTLQVDNVGNRTPPPTTRKKKPAVQKKNTKPSTSTNSRTRVTEATAGAAVSAEKQQQRRQVEIILSSAIDGIVQENVKETLASDAEERGATTTTTTTTTTTSDNDNFLLPEEKNNVRNYDDKDKDKSKVNKKTKKEMFDIVVQSRLSSQDMIMEGDEELGIKLWTMDDFEYIKKLGSGGTAIVYHAKEKQSNYEVALKVQQISSSSSATAASDDDGESDVYEDDDDYDEEDDILSSAFAEIDIHEPLNHPSVVNMIDYFYSNVNFDPSSSCSSRATRNSSSKTKSHTITKSTEASTLSAPKKKRYLYMILELCERGSLYDVICKSDNGRIDDERVASKYFMGALNAIQYIHEENLIHCDVKTANFLIATTNDNNEKEGEESLSSILKLADFGMTVRDDEREVVGGSPIYMSPEHLQAWRDCTDNFDYRVDIYGLGVVLFQILIGDLPYYVIENDDDDIDSLLACFDRLDVDDDMTFRPPLLDLRKLDDYDPTRSTGATSEPFVLPKPEFPNFVSDEAKDLILRLMESCPDKRISISEAKQHPWFQRFLSMKYD